MKNINLTNIHNLKVGDTITFTNSANCIVSLTFTRVEEKSIYTTRCGREFRESYGTVNGYIRKYNATIVRA